MTGAPIDNPYAAPTDQLQHASAAGEGEGTRALYSPRQMLAGALFGSLLVGVLMLWLNYRAMATPRLARLTFVFGFPVALLWMALGFLPVRAGDLNFVVALQFYGFCNPIQGPAVYRRYGAGRERASNWMVAALVAISALLTGLIQVAIGAGRFGL
jgi:hypothetical protein